MQRGVLKGGGGREEITLQVNFLILRRCLVAFIWTVRPSYAALRYVSNKEKEEGKRDFTSPSRPLCVRFFFYDSVSFFFASARRTSMFLLLLQAKANRDESHRRRRFYILCC